MLFISQINIFYFKLLPMLHITPSYINITLNYGVSNQNVNWNFIKYYRSEKECFIFD